MSLINIKNILRKELLPIIDDLDLNGCWSLDVMKSGDDFYLIDMTDIRDSALVDLIAKNNIDTKSNQTLSNDIKRKIKYGKTKF